MELHDESDEATPKYDLTLRGLTVEDVRKTLEAASDILRHDSCSVEQDTAIERIDTLVGRLTHEGITDLEESLECAACKAELASAQAERDDQVERSTHLGRYVCELTGEIADLRRALSERGPDFAGNYPPVGDMTMHIRHDGNPRADTSRGLADWLAIPERAEAKVSVQIQMRFPAVAPQTEDEDMALLAEHS